MWAFSALLSILPHNELPPTWREAVQNIWLSVSNDDCRVFGLLPPHQAVWPLFSLVSSLYPMLGYLISYHKLPLYVTMSGSSFLFIPSLTLFWRTLSFYHLWFLCHLGVVVLPCLISLGSGFGFCMCLWSPYVVHSLTQFKWRLKAIHRPTHAIRRCHSSMPLTWVMEHSYAAVCTAR